MCSAFVSISDEIRRSGMNRSLYRRIANAFQDFDASTSSDLVLEVLEHFVNFKDELIYVNEIRNLLREGSPSLFKEYGRKFIRCRGCFEVFGIEPVDVIDHDFRVGKTIEEKKAKKYDTQKHRKRAKNSIKRQAKARAAFNFRAKLNEKQERKRQREEMDEMLRKQNI